MFSVFLDATAKDPYTTPDLYKRSFDRYYEGIERYLLRLDVRYFVGFVEFRFERIDVRLTGTILPTF